MNAAVIARLLSGKRASIHCVLLCFLAVLVLTGWNSQAQSLSDTNQSASTTNQTTSPGDLMPPPPPPLVLTNPPPGPVPQFPAFSSLPTTKEIENARIFAEPLISIGGIPSQDENTALADAITAFASRTNADDFSALENYLNSSPDEHWRESVLFDLGWEYFNTGYYSKAINAWEEDWSLLQDATSGSAGALADHCIGELAEMHARIGDMQRLQQIFNEIGNRPVRGPASELIAGARQALWLMQNRPGISFRCGPLALLNIAKLLHPSVDADEIVEDSASTTNGFSLAQVYQLSQQLQLNFQVAKRPPGAPIPLPCVVNWKVGHYAAILKQAGNRYFVTDPTFGLSRWMSRSAIDYEASGYFLIPAGTLTNGWQSVGNTEAATVWGKGVTGNSDPNDTTVYDEMADPSCDSHGMATYNIHLMLVSLHIEDTPLAFTPPRGPAINFTVIYNQREANQPTTFHYSNFGEKWTCNWISYLTDNGTNTPGDVTYYVPGGGTETFTYNPTNSDFDINWRDQAQLVQLSSTNYEISFPDGSKDIFGQPDGTVGNSRKIFLTQVIDPTGYTNLLNYDSNLRLVSVTDPQAQATNLTFYYAVSGGITPVDIYKIQQVTDRYGRSAIFDYGYSSELQSIADPLSITSRVYYADNSDFIDALQTPYGMTTFAYSDDGGVRWLEATDPQGGKSRVEFNQSADIGIPDSDPGPLVPRNLYTRNYILYGRNTFYWDKKAMAEAPRDYSKARLYHWLHNANLASAEGCLESIKEPLENRVWFNYPGQDPYSAGATIYGSQNLPSAVGRVLDDGSSQVYYFYRNSLGKITNTIDPVGYSFSFDYATNQIDLLRVRQTSGTNNELDASFTYNSQHLPLTAVDASGQTNRFGYNSYGQITKVTNALSQVTTFNYDSAGRLLSIVGPTNTAITSFGYDSFDRVSSVTNPDSYYVHIAYDALDRPVTNTYPDGSTETITYKYLDPQTDVDRAGRLTQFTYDSLRHLTEISEATNWNTYLDWCACGNLSSITDPLERTTRWFYDIQGRIKSKQYADGSTVKYGYENTTSRVKTFTNERNQTRTFYYYPDDLFEGVVYANPSITPSVWYNYDDYYRITAMQDGYGTTAFHYYPITLPPTLGAGRLETVVDPNGYDTTTYGYDELGRVKTIVVTNSYFSTYEFLSVAIYGKVWVRTNFFDPLGRLTKFSAEPFLGTFGFNYAGASDRLSSLAYPNGVVENFDYYNAQGDFRLKDDTNNLTGSSDTYAYNESGDITNWIQRLANQNPQTNQLSHDAINELTGDVITAHALSNTLAYAYDLAGNRTLEKSNAASWMVRFNPLNEIQNKDQGLSSTNRMCQWDEENRLVRVTEGTSDTKIVYDGFGRWAQVDELQSNTNLVTHQFIWIGNSVAEEAFFTGGGSSVSFKWYYGYGLFDQYLTLPAYITRDRLGSIQENYNYNANSGILNQYRYDPYGRQTTLTNTYNNNPPHFGFAGFYQIPGHNLYLAGNRVYDPDTGRWLSRDPIGETGGLNLYEYAGNDPIDNVDPSGLCPQLGTLLGEGQYRDVNGDIRDANGDLLKDQLNPLNPINFEGENSVLNNYVEQFAAISDRIKNVAQRGYDYAVLNPRIAGLNRSRLGIDAEIQATRWLRRWAERNNIDLGVGGLQFQVRGSHSIPDVIFDPAGQIFDFKLTPKAVRSSQTRNFQNDFPGYNIKYIFGP